MSDSFYCHCWCPSEYRLTAFCRLVSTLAGDTDVRVWARRLGVRDDAERDVRTQHLAETLERVYSAGSAVSVYNFALGIPSGKRSPTDAVITEDRYREQTRDPSGPISLIVYPWAFFSRAGRRPVYPPWERGASSAIAEDEIHTDMVWLLDRVHGALPNPPSAPVVLAWDSGWPSSFGCCGVRWTDAGQVSRDFGISWLARRTRLSAVSVAAFPRDELAQLVESEPVTREEPSSNCLGLTRDDVLKLLRCDEESVRQALRAMTVESPEQREMREVVARSKELLVHATETREAELDPDARTKRWPNAPHWRLTWGPDGSVSITAAAQENLVEFYAALAGVLA
jgi:hypothetical protein